MAIIICIITQMSKKSPSNPNPGSESAPLLTECCSAPLESHLPAEFFKALGDPNRIALLARLAVCGRPATVSEIACCLPIDLSVVSRHLRQLKDAGILDCEKQGKEVRYFVLYNKFATLLRKIAKAIEECCPDSVGGCCSSITSKKRTKT